MTQLASPPSPATAPAAGPSPAPRLQAPRRAAWLAAGAVLALVLAALLSVGLGTLRLDAFEAVRAVVAPDGGQVSTVVWSIRLPRIVVAMLVGGALAGVGVVMQAVFRNPLADPGVTGVSSGAAVGAVAGITLGLGGSLQWGVPVAAFAGSLAVALVLQAVLQANRGASTYTLILVGVSINAFAGAIISVLVANAHDDALARGAVFWLAGDLELRTWTHAAMAAGPVLVGLAVLRTRVRALDALLLGDDVAATSGYDVHRTRLVLLLVASLVTGAAVAVSGVISFVGLVVPHAVRLVIGAKHALLLPISVVCGALFLLLADTLARAASVSVVVQTGAVCAVVGAPVFLALLLSRRRA
ncbi:iron ABC transporter permease [Georgenia satyanarayanai]|uniref:FecCD family ABC transporter permease n=1 Tax=Georgenia satyanarayanai TaxID=860221 RepID=UPI00203FAF1C|nr:iron ABC transporter permease [Georgenia satyanarayanai]MCM3662077.1 iron ABC transporter permease [Georgenia satyanarayanai]